MKKVVKLSIALATAFSIANLTGCASVSTAIDKRNLEVQTKMSDTVFLEPVSSDKKTIFLQFRSTADKDINVDQMKSLIVNKLTNKNYKVVQDLEDANFLVQQNILSVAKTTEKDAYSAVQAGFGGAMAGGLAGAATTGTGRGSAAGGLIGAAIGVAANAMIDDVYYNMVTDLQIKQRLPEGQQVQYTQNADAQSGSSSSLKQTRKGSSEWITYRTRIVSVANQVNLEFPEAQKELEDKLIKTTTGIF